jgi:type I restriction enzyme S subunit
MVKITLPYQGSSGSTGHWDVKPFSAADFCAAKVWVHTTGGFQSSPEIPFQKVYNIVEQKLNVDYKPQFESDSVALSKSMSRPTTLPGDVPMNIVGLLSWKVAIVTDQYPEWTFNQALTMFRPSSRISTQWLHVIPCSGKRYEDILMQTRGSAGQSNFLSTRCREMRLPIPPIDEQVEIVRRSESLFALADSIESRLAEATAQVERATWAILTKAFRGELLAVNQNDC